MLFPVTVSIHHPRLQLRASGVSCRHHPLMIAIAIAITITTLLLPRMRCAIAADAVPAARTPTTPGACLMSLNFRIRHLQDDVLQDLCQHVGRVVLIVNIASHCGYTHQYGGLEALYARYHDKGLIVLGFPSSNFQQESGNSKQITDFCYSTYGVKFSMFSRTAVVGASTPSLYTWPVAWADQPPKWSFHGYLLDRTNRVTAMFPSSVKLSDPALIKHIDALLTESPTRSPR